MRKINTNELKDILEKHSLWLSDNSKGERANLSGANLSRANLYNANLSDANLSRANLSDADLSRANLTDTCINGFYLGKHFGYAWVNKENELIIKIGCEEHNAKHWKVNFKEIGVANGYSENEIKLYSSILRALRIKYRNEGK